MHKLLFILFLLTASLSAIAQSDTAESNRLYSASLIYNSKHDYKNVVNVLRVARNIDPTNAIYRRDLALGLYNMKKHREAKAEMDSCLTLESADESCYKFASKIYTVFDDFKGAQSIINRGIAKFPNSGDLYNAKGELFYNFDKPAKAIQAWEDAIQFAPNSFDVFYNLAKVYATDTINYMRTMIVAEQFVLQEAFSLRSVEMKKIIADCYRRLLSEIEDGYSNKESSKWSTATTAEFELQLKKVIMQNRFAIAGNTNKLVAIAAMRTSLLDDYAKTIAKNYPSSMLRFWQKMEQSNVWEAYNIWLMGSYINPSYYSEWLRNNSKAMDAITKYLSENKLKPQANEFYFNTKSNE